MNVKFAVISDLHSEYIHDSAQRIEKFLETARKNKVDFCIQLGDFCPPGDKNLEHKRKIFDLIDSYNIPFYHLLGNHDMDANSKKEVLDFIGCKKSYYSFDCKDTHFVVLDTCFCELSGELLDYDYGNYKKAQQEKISVLSEKQLEWLINDIEKTDLPCVFFSHHSLTDSRASICNTSRFQEVLKHFSDKIVASFNGHEHVDRAILSNGLWYYCVNSASYYWCGSKYSHKTYGEEIEEQHPLLRKVFPFKDPLFAIVHIDGEFINISGFDSCFVGLSPENLSFVREGLADKITPSIIQRKLCLK